eukprot:SAG22_NODE_38_length_26325_cov_107.302067_29_plen_129_part_00
MLSLSFQLRRCLSSRFHNNRYGTQEPIALLRCFSDYQLWYERDKLTPRKVKNCDIAACMNPTAGSFVIDGRFQRQFATFSCQLPPAASLTLIFGSILGAHLEQVGQLRADTVVLMNPPLNPIADRYDS